MSQKQPIKDWPYGQAPIATKHHPCTSQQFRTYQSSNDPVARYYQQLDAARKAAEVAAARQLAKDVALGVVWVAVMLVACWVAADPQWIDSLGVSVGSSVGSNN